MWLKLVLLTIYLGLLFLLSRFLETVAYYDSGYLASRILDPVSLSVRKLKILLDQRGMSYTGLVEKKELTELVEASGEVSEGEADAACSAAKGDEETTVSSTNFTCGTHLYEEVKDAKDSVWVVQVVREPADVFLHPNDWKLFIKKVARFGIRTGIFDCSLDWRLCESKKWLRSGLVMALPQGFRPKDKVILRAYSGPTRVQAVLDWVNTNLASRIHEIYTFHQLRKDWFLKDDPKQQSKIHVVLFSRMTKPPMFFSVLSVKFTGRVKFGTVNLLNKESKNILKKLQFHRIPQYLVITPEGNFTFGKRKGEYLNYSSMAVLLRMLHPEVNDMFLLTLILVNAACWLELALTRGAWLRRIGNMLWNTVKWNCLLILLWLPVLGVVQLPLVASALHYILKLLRMSSLTTVATQLRADWLAYTSCHAPVLLISFPLFTLIVGLLHLLYQRQHPELETPVLNNNTDWWNFNLDSYFSYLFRPISTLSRPMGPTDMDLEVGMELLIERLAVPNLWLQPIIPCNYMKELPVWHYAGPTVDSDIASDCDTICSDDGETEDNSSGFSHIPSLPNLFICEKCRQQERQTKEDSQEQRRDREAAQEHENECAKYLMDGDYKCHCHRSMPNNRRSPKRSKTIRTAPLNVDSEQTPNSGPPGILPSTECAICLESYKYGVFLCGLPCGHSFHQNCIMTWLGRDNHCCPVCRWPTYKAKPCSVHLHAE